MRNGNMDCPIRFEGGGVQSDARHLFCFKLGKFLNLYVFFSLPGREILLTSLIISQVKKIKKYKLNSVNIILYNLNAPPFFPSLDLA